MADTMKGGCFCGAVRYEYSGEIQWPGNCHCRACRKLGGGKGGSWIGMQAADLKTSGETSSFSYTADSGNKVTRFVCANCYSPVYNQNSARPDMRVIPAGSLDDPSLFKPGIEIYTSEAPEWDPMIAGLPQFETMPNPAG